MAELTSSLEKVLRDCGLGRDSCWKHKQSGKWVIYHWACEVIAAKKHITFAPPTIVQADAERKLAVILVSGHPHGEPNRAEWSFGEAAPYNTTQTYPFAMAEKRAKDRVILKLVGLHGEAYSEEEADALKKAPPEDPIVFSPLTKTALEKKLRAFHNEIKACDDLGTLAGLQESYKDELDQCQKQLKHWWEGSDDWHGLSGAVLARKKHIEQAEEGIGS